MFGRNASSKKNKKDQKKSEAEVRQFHIDVIPPPFYGGNDPEIYHNVTKEEKAVTKETPELTLKKTPPPQPKQLQQKRSKKKVLLLAAGLFLFSLGGISWYYIRDLQPPAVEETKPATDQFVTKPTSTPQQEPTSTTSSLPQNTPSPTSTVVLDDTIDFPQFLLTAAADVDTDQLTDIEEEVFGTDSGVWDTDADGYFDGQEVVNLYNPKGFAPQRIVDSGLVREYVHPVVGYRLYYPAQWSIGAVDPEARQVLMSAITGDYIQIRIFERQTGETFAAWFARVVRGEQFTEIGRFSSRFKVEGQKRRDGLVGYFMTESAVYTISYHPTESGALLYPHIMEMVLQSFRPTKTTVELPTQTILPGTTSTVPFLPPSTSTAESATSTDL